MANQPSTNQDAIQGDGDNTKGAVETAAPLLVLKQLDKRFGATHALKAVNLSFEAGEGYPSVVENGPAKLTVFKLQTGGYLRAVGDAYSVGPTAVLTSTHEAIRLGV